MALVEYCRLHAAVPAIPVPVWKRCNSVRVAKSHSTSIAVNTSTFCVSRWVQCTYLLCVEIDSQRPIRFLTVWYYVNYLVPGGRGVSWVVVLSSSRQCSPCGLWRGQGQMGSPFLTLLGPRYYDRKLSKCGHVPSHPRLPRARQI